jgi:non-ribosomal peptide synthetase component E (peptide arylation enzyme)
VVVGGEATRAEGPLSCLRERVGLGVAHLREEGIAAFKLPERLELRDELPRNPLGKILKRDLRDELR